LLQGKQYVGGIFDPSYNESGKDGLFLRTIGMAVYPASTSEATVRSAAVADGKQKLITSAPTEFRSMVQSAMGNAMGFTGNLNSIETTITNVSRLEGIEVNQRDIDCRLVIEPNVQGAFRNNRECRAVVRVPVLSIRKAFEYTLEQANSKKLRARVEKMLDSQAEAFFGNKATEKTGASQQRSQIAPSSESKLLILATSEAGAPNLQSVANRHIAPRLEGQFRFVRAASFGREARRLRIHSRHWHKPLTVARVGARLQLDYVVSIHTRPSPPTRAFLSEITIHSIADGKPVLKLSHQWTNKRGKFSLSSVISESINRYLASLVSEAESDLEPMIAQATAQTKQSRDAAAFNRLLLKF